MVMNFVKGRREIGGGGKGWICDDFLFLSDKVLATKSVNDQLFALHSPVEISYVICIANCQRLLGLCLFFWKDGLGEKGEKRAEQTCGSLKVTSSIVAFRDVDTVIHAAF